MLFQLEPPGLSLSLRHYGELVDNVNKDLKELDFHLREVRRVEVEQTLNLCFDPACFQPLRKTRV